MEDKLIVANCSGFLGDRLEAAREMVEGGPIHVLTGDYLAELTMALLFRMKMKSPDKGYVVQFLNQMETIMGTCLDKGIKVVTNAGGLNPRGLVNALEQLAATLGLHPTIACITGDDLMPDLGKLQAHGEPFVHMDTGEILAQSKGQPITANAYLGGWGITRALQEGADIVVGGRLADAALVSGPAAWKFNWQPTDWDQLAGAYVAGHIIECGTQATGGNYAFMDEISSYKNVGFPIAEIFEDGSCVITKHPGTGGRVSRGTVTAQLLYEIQSPAYSTPDVVARFDTLTLTDEGNDRVRITGIRGQAPSKHLKVCVNTMWGYQNTMTVLLTGLDIEKKAAIVEETLFDLLGGKDQFADTQVLLIRSDKPDPDQNDLAHARLRISVRDPDPDKVGKRFSAKLVEMALANIPGYTLTSPPTSGTPAIRHWPALITAKAVGHQVHVRGKTITIEPVPEASEAIPTDWKLPEVKDFSGQPVASVPFGRLFGTRSGDKGGNANLGVWARHPDAYGFLVSYLTCDQLKRLLPDLAPYPVEGYPLPNLLALNFYIRGILGHGVAASFRVDPQAKTLGEYLRAKIIQVPVTILEQQ